MSTISLFSFPKWSLCTIKVKFSPSQFIRGRISHEPGCCSARHHMNAPQNKTHNLLHIHIQLIFSGRLHWQCLDPFTQQDVGLDSALPHPSHITFFVADGLLETLWNPPAEAAEHYGFHHLNHTYSTWNLSAHPHGHQGIQEHLLIWQIPTARKNLYCWLSAFHSLVRGFGAVSDTGLQSGIQVRLCLVAMLLALLTVWAAGVQVQGGEGSLCFPLGITTFILSPDQLRTRGHRWPL